MDELFLSQIEPGQRRAFADALERTAGLAMDAGVPTRSRGKR